jgi:DNA polymerase-3 subunit alpha
MGIKIMPPDVNSSYFAFSVNADAIIFGLGAIKGIGSKAVECMVNARQSKAFHGLRDFCHRADLSAINKKVVEQLVRVGAFDNFGIPRQALLPLMMPYYREGQEYQKSKRTGQKSLFELKGGSRVFDDEPDLELRDSQVEKLAWEKELAGVYFSGHPMEPYREYVRLVSSHEVIQLCSTDAEGRASVDDNTRVLVAGMVCGFRRRVSKSSGEDWASFRLVDFTGGIDCVVFARQFKNVTFKLLDDQIVVVSGVKRKQSYSNEPQIIADSVEQLDFLHESGKWKSDIGVVLDVRGIADDTIRVFRELASQFPGQKRPLVYCDVNGYKVNLEMPSRLGVSGNPDCVRAFYQAFGREALRLHVAPPPVQGNRN